MTKTIRIENADTSNHPVRVTGQYKNAEGQWLDETSSIQLDHPTRQVEQTIYGARRIIIEERPADLPSQP